MAFWEDFDGLVGEIWRTVEEHNEMCTTAAGLDSQDTSADTKYFKNLFFLRERLV